MKFVTVIVLMLMLTGCASEVDKCVEAEMKAWRAQKNAALEINERLKPYNEGVKKYNDEVKAYNDKQPISDATPSMIGKSVKSLEQIDREFENSLYKNQKPYKEYILEVIDERPIEVVEAQFRRNCMGLSSK